MEKYDSKKIGQKWQGKLKTFKAIDNSKNPKFYILLEFPYPSGDGLHVGHCRPYIAFDVISRKRRMEGYNVLFPMGWDAFGLPTENYAIKKGIHPSIATKNNTENFKRQMKMIELSFDWSREINTTDPGYYKWTQWIFIQLFKNGLAYKKKMPINWCPSCKIGLANEEVIDNKCERCGTEVEKKDKDQWLIKITKYADRLINDLDKVDYPEKVKIQQKEWIGRSEGAIVKFLISNFQFPIEVFTTRIDTIFSGTFLILSPEHPFIDKHRDEIKNIEEVLEYRKKTAKISDAEKTNLKKEISGVELKGISVVNPATGEKMPVWIADFVLSGYGTGAVFADAHDKRDFDLAKKYGLPLKTSILPEDEKFSQKVKNLEECFEGEGILYNSKQFDGLTSADARPKIISWLKEKGLADGKVSYKLRDWIFSRQHYWGEPIPMVNCKNCGWVPVKENDLPIELPKVEKYQPTDTGESPLSKIDKWVNVKCPKCKGEAKRETDTMPNWAGSNWYYLAYLMQGISNFQFPISNYKEAFKYWMPVDWYNGGMEHTTLHLLYSRFIFKFLYDIGAVPKEIGSEPYKKRTSHGMVLGEGGIKMSKSKGNVINPDDVVKEYSADTLRVYEMFMGPFEQMIPWDTKGVKGVERFLSKVWQLQEKAKGNDSLKALLNKTIKKVTEDIETLKFNTAVSSLMILSNEMDKKESISSEDYSLFLTLLNPFAPVITEEIWQQLKLKGQCCEQKWPKYDSKMAKDDRINLIVQINGKVRDKIEVEANISEEEAKKRAMESDKIKKWLEGKEIKKTIFAAGKLVNFVTIDKRA